MSVIKNAERILALMEQEEWDFAEIDRSTLSNLIDLAKHGEKMRWIPVSEMLPRKGQLCDIIFRFSNRIARVCEVTYTGKKGFDHGAFPVELTTHWRLSENDTPLPDMGY